MRARLLPAVLAAGLVATGTAHAVIPSQAPDLPVLGAQVPKGTILTEQASAVAPTPKVVDGNIGDWTGEITRLGGTAIYSRGEYTYQDYLMDDWGADDGQDANRALVTDTVAGAEPRTYRVEALPQAAGDQFDAPRPVGAEIRYGDASVPPGRADEADIEEVRIAADAENVYVLVRLAQMTATDRASVIVLLDTAPGGAYQVAGGLTTGAEWTFHFSAAEMHGISHEGGSVHFADSETLPWNIAYNAADFTNAIELSLDRDVFALPSALGLGLATGYTQPDTDPAPDHGLAQVRQGDAQSDWINVAFRAQEPARIWMDHDQALALREGNIDEFLAPVDLAALAGGATESFAPNPGGYFERILESDSAVVRESSDNGYHQGRFQHYGMYLPTAYKTPNGCVPCPATWSTHYRGGHAHDAAAWVPGLLRQLGEQAGNIVISPGARGTSSWYVGRGHEDFLDVWDDSMASFAIDPNRVYLSGYSMGGFASYLLGLLYPDRWAAAFPTSGPPTQGQWTGFTTPSQSQNGGNAQTEFTYNILENARNVPYVIYQGTNDELVPSSGIVAVSERLRALGYRYRLYLFPGYEHYSHAIVDQWTDAAQYLNRFVRDPNPRHVTYKMWPALERAVETVSPPPGAPASLDYQFNRAYWVSGLEMATPGAALDNFGSIDATTLARPGGFDPALASEAGTNAVTLVELEQELLVPPGQHTPFVMRGQRWLDNAPPAPQNRFVATLANLSAATLDVARMSLETAVAMSASISTDHPLTLTLVGAWPASVTVVGPSGYMLDGSMLSITLDPGTHELAITS